MPVPNDLTPEEEAEFGQHGVTPAGQGREPLSEAPPEQQAAQQQVEQHQTPDAGQQQTQQSQPRDAGGRFASQQQQEEGQQPQQEEGQQPQQEEGQQTQERKMVPLEALHQARRQIQTLSTRMNAILQQKQPTQQPQMPSLEEDPAGYILALEERLANFENIRAQETEYRQIDNALTQDEEIFAMEHPEYHQASDYYVQSRARELAQFNPPEQIQQMLLREARTIANESWKNGRSAAEVIYELALSRGFNPGMPQREPVQQTQQQQAPQNGAQQQQRRGPTAKDVVASVANGQRASQSLSGGAGGASTEALNAAALLDMDDAEFANWLGEGAGATKRFANIGN